MDLCVREGGGAAGLSKAGGWKNASKVNTKHINLVETKKKRR